MSNRKSPKSRLDYWRDNPWKIGAVCRHEDDGDALQAAWQDRVANPKRPRGSEGFGTVELTRMSREIVYFHDDKGKPSFCYVIFGIDFGSAEIDVHEAFSVIEPDREQILRAIGVAYAFNVPLVPDSPDLGSELQAWEREFFTYGIEADEGSGRLMPSRYVDLDIDSLEALDGLGSTQPIHPSEVRVLLETVRKELSVLKEAQRAMDSLRNGIEELSRFLEQEDCTEHELQRCLTRHPILFGPEYVRMIPKFRLGGDFEMDFALQRSSGLVDLVEIEAARHPLFTKKGDPRAQLVHAEQQVINWHAWIDHHGELARRDLPELQRPIGLVVIGRDSLLEAGDTQRLRQRNLILSPMVEVMTYDGLLQKAKNLQGHFESLRDAAPSMT